MTDYIKRLKDDLVEQFKGKPYIDGLVEVIGRQFNELFAFYQQLQNETDVYDAVGKQLDGIGDIVVLSRSEAGQMITGEGVTNNPDDETYRRYLIYKILKNTCDCTYSDIMRAIKMFWSGPPLRYSEDPDKPATICFDFEASKDLADQAIGIPFVRAGGVGLYMKMQKTDDFTVYFGFALQRSATEVFECKEAVIDPRTYLSDEFDIILADEVGAWFVE